jgi:protein phosphatase
MVPDPNLHEPTLQELAVTAGVTPDNFATPDSPAMPAPSVMPNHLPQDELPSLSEDELPLMMGDEEETEFLVAASADSDGGDDMPTVLLPMQLVSLESVGATHVGRQRTHNEDCFNIQTQLTTSETPQGKTLQAKGLYILCDGMGGHSSGEVASAMAVEQIKAYFKIHWKDSLPSEEVIREGLRSANLAIFEANERKASLGNDRMGTTVVILLIQNNQAAVAHVGDSRLYRYTRRQGIEQMTIDHEVGQLEIRRGVEPDIAYSHPGAYQLTQALGPKDNDYIYPEVEFFDFQEDILLLLCSDGLSDYNLLEEHPDMLENLRSSRTVLDQGVSQLMDLANTHNGHDNITAIAVRARVRPNLQAMKL